MAAITDEFMMQMISTTKPYVLLILKSAPNPPAEGVKEIIWEHGRRNFSLRQEGLLSIVCPVSEEGDVSGIGIFNTTKEKATELMEEDPGIKAGVFTYELYECISFPGDQLPA